MARELPIQNGRLTTDLDANGFKIKNLPPGSGFTQAQSDWGQTDVTAPDYIKNKPTIPSPTSVDPTLSVQGAAADAKATGDALAAKRGVTDLGVRGAPTIAAGAAVGKFFVDGVECTFDSSRSVWKAGDDYEGCEIDIVNASPLTYRITDFADMSGDPPVAPVESFTLSEANGYAATALGHTITGYTDALTKTSQLPTKMSDLTNDSGYITQHQQLTPIYGGNGQQYGDWVYSGIPQDATGIELPTMEPDGRWVAQFLYGGDTYFGAVYADKNATRLDFEFESSTPDTPKFNVTATLALNPVIGYTLGDQTTKPLQPQGEYAPATNIAKTALASGVQASLALADTAVQPSALRYDLITITTGQLQDRAVQKVVLNAASTTLVLPTLTDLTGKVSDFGIDMMNAYEDSGTAAAASFQLAGTLGTDYNLIVPKGETWSDMTALAAGEMAVYYFTLSAFAIDGLPTWEVAKKVVELVPVPTAP